MTVGVKYHVYIYEDAPDNLWAKVHELPGCFAAGETMDDLWKSLSEAIRLYLSETSQVAAEEDDR